MLTAGLICLTWWRESFIFKEMIAGFLKIVFYALLIYAVYLVYRFFRALGKSQKPPKTANRPSGLMVKDEVCNTYLPKEHAIKEIYEGKEYYFCSKECRQKFLEQKKGKNLLTKTRNK